MNPDGTISFITIVPGINGLDFVVGRRGDKTSVDAARRAARVRAGGEVDVHRSSILGGRLNPSIEIGGVVAEKRDYLHLIKA